MQHHRKYPSGRTLVPRSDVCAHQTAGVVGVLCFESGVASDDYYRGAQRRPHPLLIFRTGVTLGYPLRGIPPASSLANLPARMRWCRWISLRELLEISARISH
ncbi:uncharacterized protein LOC115632650 [Scaptodrosophila lebanonensis]|uniref:Uncharacterized protein LOC115627649 isoform X2 n=1 Tax=Drosophila lebanonensis TaxID=7225 RepID=A0A6J2TV52_DROLE|nr:uncharacterized protein LOC115627649 isoform X2 [Scaptodrosophila lebanonensis]XP_030379969.1 uncharacterized protein LOC115628129 [Scaptodrosophila lebanonensis]XP_030385740.1 uncharacterized protein LOC115632650 [Scaptodrosophila lebanonensis]